MIRRDSAAYIRDPRRGLRLVGFSRRKALTDAAVWIHDRDDRFAWAAVAVSTVLFFYAVAYAFPHARLIAKQQAQEAIEQESRTFCEKHAMPFGSREHTACIKDLIDIRPNERQRTLADLSIF
jgi:hypothetical protein